MERERARYYARSIGNALLVATAIVAVLGAFAIWRMALDIDDRFGFGSEDGPGLDDYVLVLFGYFSATITAVGIVGGLGLYFRWLAVEQDARMSEFDALLGALGVPFEDDEDGHPADTASDA